MYTTFSVRGFIKYYFMVDSMKSSIVWITTGLLYICSRVVLMIAARKQPESGGGYSPTKLYEKSVDRLREMALGSKKVLGKRMFMNAIADAAIEEYYIRHFKNHTSAPEPKKRR